MVLIQNFCGSIKNNPIINGVFKKYFHPSLSLPSKCSESKEKSKIKCKDSKDKSKGKGKGENIVKELFVTLSSEKPRKKRKVTICGGGGQTGIAMGYTLLIQNYCDEIVLFDRKESAVKLMGEYLDLVHGISVRHSPNVVTCMDMKNTADSELIIFNSGSPTKKGQTRLDVAQVNINHFAEVVPKLAKLSPKSVMLVITNPSDIMTYACWKYSGFEKNRIIGTGTELDSTRFRYHIAKRLKINPASVDGWIIGEHGESSVPVWSSVGVAGTKLRDIDPTIGSCDDKNCWNKLHKQVIKDGPMVHHMKGCTQYAIGQIGDIVARAVLTNDRTIHSVSTQLTGLYGIEQDVFLSMPCVIGNRGVAEIVQLCLEDDEVEKLNQSACVLQNHVKKMKFP